MGFAQGFQASTFLPLNLPFHAALRSLCPVDAAGGLLRPAGRCSLPGGPHAHVSSAGAHPHGDDAGAPNAARPDAGEPG